MRILIVGAGPSGAALSLLLARRGVEVVLLEREASPERVFRGEALMPSGVDAISQMGLREQFAGLPQRTLECMEFYVEGTRMFRADWPEVAGENSLHIVSQPALINMLTSAAAEHARFELRAGSTVRNLEVTDDGVTLRVQNGDIEEELHGDFVIGADGRASTVRARSGLDIMRLPFPFDVAWFSVPMPSTQYEDPRFQVFTRDDTSVVLYPSWNGQLRLGLNLPALQSDGQAKLPKEEMLLEAGRVVGEPYATLIRDHRDEIADPVILKVLFGRCERWTAPRTLLLGDAAHPMSPVRAQGINLALRDAVVTANHLLPAIETGDPHALQTAAERIQAERDPEIIESQRLQVSVARPPAPARSAFLRSTLLPVMERLGVVKRIYLKTEIPLRHGVVPVELAI